MIRLGISSREERKSGENPAQSRCRMRGVPHNMPLERRFWEGVRKMMSLEPEYSPNVDEITPCEGQGGVSFYAHIPQNTPRDGVRL